MADAWDLNTKSQCCQSLEQNSFSGDDCFSKIRQQEVEVQKSLNLGQPMGLISENTVQLTQITLGNHRNHSHVQ